MEDKTLLQRSRLCHKGEFRARKHQCSTVITTMPTKSSWALLESFTADDSWILRSSNDDQREDKSAHNSTTEVFLHHYYTFMSLHDSDHDGVV